MNLIFHRQIEVDLLEMVKEIPVIGLLGPRQVGKTTLAKSILTKLPKDSIYLDLESSADLFKLQYAERFLTQHEDKVVVLDEIQRMPEIFPILRSLIDKNREPGRFIILGSASPSLLKQSSESLAGRISYFQLEPLQFPEVAHSISQEVHWFRGGFPEMLLASSDRLFLRKMDDFITTYIERDLPNLGLPSRPFQTRLLLQMLLSIHGNLLNISGLSRSMGLSAPTIATYIDFLEQAFLVRLLRPYFSNRGKRLVKSPKLFFRDSGMLHCLAGMRSVDDVYANFLVGASWEGFVIQQVISNLPFQVYPYFYRTQDGAEIDLVLEKGGNPYLLIEVKYSPHPVIAKGNYQVQKDLGNIPMRIVIPGTDLEEIHVADNISICSLSQVFKYL